MSPHSTAINIYPHPVRQIVIHWYVSILALKHFLQLRRKKRQTPTLESFLKRHTKNVFNTEKCRCTPHTYFKWNCNPLRMNLISHDFHIAFLWRWIWFQTLFTCSDDFQLLWTQFISMTEVKIPNNFYWNPILQNFYQLYPLEFKQRIVVTW